MAETISYPGGGFMDYIMGLSLVCMLIVILAVVMTVAERMHDGDSQEGHEGASEEGYKGQSQAAAD